MGQGALVVGRRLLPQRSRLGAGSLISFGEEGVALNGWIKNGFARTKAQVAQWTVSKLAREIGINATGGPTSVIDAWYVVRSAAATARASLLGAASLRWRLPVEELAVRDGVISHPSGKPATSVVCAAAASRIAGVPLEDVTVHVTLLGAGFGRRLEVDYAAFAVRVAMDCPGSPVQLAWPSRRRHDS